MTVTTDAAGRATATGLSPTGTGALRIAASAAFQGQTATVSIAQATVMTAAEASSIASGAAGVGGAAGGGGAGLSATTLSVIGAAAAGGAIVAVKALGGEPNSFSGAWTGLAPDGISLPNAQCETAWDLFLDLTDSNGQVTGTSMFRARVTRGGPTCAQLGATFGGTVSGTTSGNSITFTVTVGSFGTADFTGTLSGTRISGLTTFRFGTPGGDSGTWAAARNAS